MLYPLNTLILCSGKGGENTATMFQFGKNFYEFHNF